MLTTRDEGHQGAGRARRPLRVELRAVRGAPSAEELRQREQELERLIVKAACHRAARLAGQPGAGAGPVVCGDAREASGVPRAVKAIG